MERERAKVGDVMLTLASDNRCDLDLHVICPNGNHISYHNKQGLGKNGGGYLDVDMNVNGESRAGGFFFRGRRKGDRDRSGKVQGLRL